MSIFKHEYMMYALFFTERIGVFENKRLWISIFRFLNQWQVTLFRSHGIKFIDHYVSVDQDGKYKLVYVYKRDEAEELLQRFRNYELEMGNDVVKYNN